MSLLESIQCLQEQGGPPRWALDFTRLWSCEIKKSSTSQGLLQRTRVQRDGKMSYREEIKGLQPRALRAIYFRTSGSLIDKMGIGNLQKCVCGRMCARMGRGGYYVQFSKLDRSENSYVSHIDVLVRQRAYTYEYMHWVCVYVSKQWLD